MTCSEFLLPFFVANWGKCRPSKVTSAWFLNTWNHVGLMGPNVTKEILLFHLMFASLICQLSSRTSFDEKKKKKAWNSWGIRGGRVWFVIQFCFSFSICVFFFFLSTNTFLVVFFFFNMRASECWLIVSLHPVLVSDDKLFKAQLCDF